jgi:hypothetical protein
VRIFSITAGPSMQAMTLTWPSQLLQIAMLGIDRIKALFRHSIKYRQVIKPSSIGASTRCGSKLRPFSHEDFVFMLPGEA